jgi:hypothetical protein
VYNDLDSAGKKLHLLKIREWCNENSARPPQDLVSQTINTSLEWNEFSYAMSRSLYGNYVSLSTDIARRSADFPDNQDEVTEILCKLKSPEILPHMRKMVEAENKLARMWAATYLLEMGDTSKNEGLTVLQEILATDDGSYYYPKVFDLLIEMNRPVAFSLAEAILDFPPYAEKEPLWGYQHTFVRQLVLGKSQKAFAYTISGLTSNVVNSSAEPRYAEHLQMVADWRTDDYKYDYEWPNSKKKEEALKMKGWLEKQFELILQGAPHEIRTEVDGDGLPSFFLDSP